MNAQVLLALFLFGSCLTSCGRERLELSPQLPEAQPQQREEKRVAIPASVLLYEPSQTQNEITLKDALTNWQTRAINAELKLERCQCARPNKQ